MRRRGFRQYKRPGLTYWYRPELDGNTDPASPVETRTSASAVKSRTPLVFVHGVGLGPLPYLSFVDRLTSSTDGALIVVELPYVSQRLSGIPKVPPQAHLVKAIESAMAEHQITA